MAYKYFIECCRTGSAVVLGAVTGLVSSTAYLLITGLNCIDLKRFLQIGFDSAQLNLTQVLYDIEHGKSFDLPITIDIDAQGASACKDAVIWGTVIGTSVATAGLLTYYAARKCCASRATPDSYEGYQRLPRSDSRDRFSV